MKRVRALGSAILSLGGEGHRVGPRHLRGSGGPLSFG